MLKLGVNKRNPGEMPGQVPVIWSGFLVVTIGSMGVLRKMKKNIDLGQHDLRFAVKAERHSKGNNNIPGGLGPGGMFLWIVSSHGIQL